MIDTCNSGGRASMAIGPAFRTFLSALMAMPAISAARVPSAHAQKPALSRACLQLGVCDDADRGITHDAPPPRNIFHVDATLHDKEVKCQGELLHVFELALSGEPVVVNGVLNMVKLLNEAASSVCYSNLYPMLNTAQQALIIQRIKVANSCIQDAESALYAGDSQIGLARVSSAVTAFQVAGQTLTKGADRALAVGAVGDAAKQLAKNILNTMGIAGKGITGVVGLIEVAAANHLLKDIIQDFVAEHVEDALLDASDLDGRVASTLTSGYDQKINPSLTGFIGSYQCP